MEQLIQDWGYVALFLYSFGGGFVGLIFAGVLSYLQLGKNLNN